MRRIPLVLALAAAAGFGGCYRYDMRATNTSAQDVRISLHRGKHQREISTVVLTPGASVGWAGQTQRPLMLRVRSDATAADTLEIAVPRRVHTQFEVIAQDGGLMVTSDQPTTIAQACCTDGSCPECQATEGAAQHQDGAPHEAAAEAPPVENEPAPERIELDEG